MSAPASDVESTRPLVTTGLSDAGGALWSWPRTFVELAVRESAFLALLACGFVLAAASYQTPALAMWVGFLFAGYAATTNDSIQTIGTFLASNAERPWWVLWLYIGGIFLLTVGYSWVVFDGDVTFQRLTTKGFETSPTQFSFLQVAAPLFLLVLTRMKVPVSTTFLCLSGFAASGSSIGSMLHKSVLGYGVAFVLAIALWTVVARHSERLFRGEAHAAWVPVQWLTSGALWSVWLMQDAANVAVFLPRKLDALQFAGFAGIMFASLGLLFFMRGDRIQEVVTEKTGVVDVRAATLIDLVYAAILWTFKVYSNVPMSTTWVFVGLLAGREVAIALTTTRHAGLGHAARLMGKDLLAVTVGLVVSLGLASAVNPVIRDDLLASLLGMLGL